MACIRDNEGEITDLLPGLTLLGFIPCFHSYRMHLPDVVICKMSPHVISSYIMVVSPYYFTDPQICTTRSVDVLHIKVVTSPMVVLYTPKTGKRLLPCVLSDRERLSECVVADVEHSSTTTFTDLRTVHAVQDGN